MKRKPAKTTKAKRPVGRPRKKPACLASSFPGAFTLAKRPDHHPLSELLPGQSEAEREAMRLSLSVSGQLDPIILLQDDQGDGILDGRHRDELLRELGVEPVYVDFDLKWGSPLDYVVSKATHRNMTDTQKACAAVGIEEEISKQFVARRNSALKKGEAAPVPEPVPERGESREWAGKIFGVSGRYVSMAKLLKAEATDLFKLAFDGDPKHPLTVCTRIYRARLRRSELDAKATAARSDPTHGDGWIVIVGDCVKKMPKVEAKARLAFADPPYNEGLDYGPGVDDKLSYPKYLDWTHQWLAGCVDLLTEDGSLFVMNSIRWQAQTWEICRQLGLHFRNTIVNVETFGNYTDANFTNCARVIHYFTRQPSRFAWNPDEIKIESDRQKQNDKRAKEGGKVPGNVWEYPRLVGTAKERHKHFPTQLPREMLERIVRAASDPGDLVLDPFGGSGTTAHAALACGRRAITIEKVPANADFIRTRLTAAAADLKKSQKGAAA